MIRAIRSSPEPQLATPRVLGIDDWAKRKGQEYGTILLVDLEAQQPVDVLDSRTAEAVVKWLKEHPGIEIVSRDRRTEYIKGVSEGAPAAEQIADRWHLLSNLREALVALLEKKNSAGKRAVPMPHKDLAAVRNALCHVWSNGQTEGQVNRLKFLKRQMYGRAKFDLLRKRVLPRSAPT